MCAERDGTRFPVDGQKVTGRDSDVPDAEGVSLNVDRRADHGRNPPAPGHDCCVADHPTAGGEDAFCHLHAADVRR